MKKLYLFWDEFKDNFSDIALNTVIITFAAVFISFALFAVKEYISSLLYYMNPNAQGMVKICSISSNGEPAAEITESYPEMDYCIDAVFYNDAVALAGNISLCTVSKDFFSNDLGLTRNGLYEELTDNSQSIKVIATKKSGLNNGQKFSLNDGTKCVVAEVWDNNAVYNMINGFVINEKAVIVLDSAINAKEFEIFCRVRIGKVSSMSTEEFVKKYDNEITAKDMIVFEFDGFDSVANEFSGSITLTILSAAVFFTACVAILINNYLSYEKRKRTYEILLLLGSRRKALLLNSILTRIVQLIVVTFASFAVSYAISCFINDTVFSSSSTCCAIGIVGLLSLVGLMRTYLFLKKTETAR